MGRDQIRVLVGAAVSVTLVIAGALVMDWYRLSLEGFATEVARIGIDLRSMFICNASDQCVSAPLSLLPGMYPTLSTAALWSCLVFAAVVALQTASYLLSGNASETLTRIGYALALIAISVVLATAYLFGPEGEETALNVAADLSGALHRTWGPVTLLAGLLAGLAALYIAATRDSSDAGAAYKPISLPSAQALPAATRPTSGVLTMGPAAGQTAPDREPGIPVEDTHRLTGAAAEPGAPVARAMTGSIPPVRATSGSLSPIRALSGSMPRAVSGPMARATSGPMARAASGTLPAIRSKTGSIPPVPEHLRNRLQYVAITAELTGGGVDARREDGSSRLVLWRDVVGVVVRRLPPAYDGAVFVDLVSLAGSTLRLVPWTRLTGEPIAVDGETPDDKARRIVERVIAMAPAAKVDPATRHFLDTGEAAQLPDLQTLQLHDAHLA